eukprot:Seg365.3 transcript_id=Seg365.3/GoldUCD/mRNA.D3Y31 product="hypothetical protein" protein_id=Seg365.3/GoldUCD/D3Y31
MVSGIDSCSSKFSCLWCKCPSEEPYNTALKWSMIDTMQGARTVQEITSMAAIKSKANKFNCSNPPLFNFIPITRVVPDSLHLFLRISDQLIHQLIRDIKQLDNITNSTKLDKITDDRMARICSFQNFIKDLGLHDFKFYVDKDTRCLKYRDFTGPEKQQILANIKKVMHHLLSSATQFVNRKMEEPIAKNFLPFSITKIKNEGDGFKICDDHFQNQIYKLREQTQIAIVEQERKLLAYLDPLGEDLDEDIEKMKYFYDNITNVRGDWLLLTNSKYLEQKETEVQTAKKPEQSGMYCFLYALQIMTSQTYPKELDYTQITPWVINTVLRNSEEDEDEDDVVSDDDETQFNI